MPAHEWEIARAEEEGVTIHHSWGPGRIIEKKNNHIAGVEFKRCLEVYDQKGKFQPRYDEETKIFMEANQAVFAIGQMADRNMLPSMTAEDGGFLTNKEGIFAAGDCRKKLLRQIATAVGDGATAAFAAEKYLEAKE